ncbi:hypothetical protein FJ471_31005 [Mesorhizobium sp. B2-7-1]|nr:hypothetical protein FJ471_31005 [Mesorhizobium sp. B2-7-1]
MGGGFNPETTFSGAFNDPIGDRYRRVADNPRAAVRERALEHSRSERKVVTISVGVAVSGPTARHNPTSYAAKAAHTTGRAGRWLSTDSASAQGVKS